MAIGAIIGVLMGIYGTSMTITPFQRAIQYQLNSLIPNLELEIYEAIEAYFRNIITEDDLRTRLKRHGVSVENTFYLINISKRIFTVEQAIYLYRRGYLTNDELDKILRANKVDPSDKEKWFKLTEYFPSPTDIIRFAVREVFTPEIVEKYRMLEDLPREYLELAKQVGIPEEVAKWYWAAHWELPSLTMGFELFRRKVISEDELKTLMRTLDIMPGWRDKLIQLAYDLPTRVDLRRMYEMGVITRDELREYYEKLGYSPRDAELLTRWTEIEYAREDKQLTVKQILELYEMGELKRDEALDLLNKMGYPKEIAEYKLTLYEHDIALKEAKEQLNLLIEMYKTNVITYEELVDRANTLPLNPTTINKALIKAYREKTSKRRFPSIQTLKKWLKLNLISLDEFKERLSEMGYEESDIEKFIREAQVMTNLEALTAGD